MNTEVGAGTLNPATFLRVLGPEPWRVAYVEPSVRPDDSRYGYNPNRIQMHTQFQVILKPEPGDPQEQYLDSLRALGIDTARHDIRFVEDNWEAPALGAWGLGWEVWLDGLEITQFTYFQQAGGFSLDPVSVELTYGIERIVMALQGVTHFKDIVYAPGVTYGEVFGEAEHEMSAYYLDDADIDDLRTLFDVYERETRRLIHRRRPVPAHGYVLKCSHTFNVLDSRGAIAAAERTRAFARMRALAHDVAALWVERRQELGHPLGLTSRLPAPNVPDPVHVDVLRAAPLAFEIGVEELPAAEVTRAIEKVRSGLTKGLAHARLRHGAAHVVGSPRRVVAIVEDVQPLEDDHEETVRGPRASDAYDADGQPKRAALGFARSQGIEVDELRRTTLDGVEYVVVVRHVHGRPAAVVLAGVLADVVASLRAERNMRWGTPDLSFARPIRWLLALLGDQVVSFAVSTLLSGRVTRLHHSADEPVLRVDRADGYLDLLERHGIVADGERRRRAILAAATELSASAGGRIDADAESPLLDEISNLVEQPVGILGRFDERYLALPDPIVTTVMKKHQRYLPVRRNDGGLFPCFVAIANGECDRDLVRAGNEAVLRARYEDTSFFWNSDLAVAPERMKEDLAKLTFEERLGSMADRARRIEATAAELAELARLGLAERTVMARAGELAKFDLASKMVIELSTVAGVMAREYALRAGEAPEVAQALFEMELPRFAGDELPASRPGAILALADRFDLIAGLFAVGAGPTGSSDPLGLRRAASGVTAILSKHPSLAPITIANGLNTATRRLPVELDPAARQEALSFIVRRFQQSLVESDYPVELIRAIAPVAMTPARAEDTIRELTRLRGNERFQQLVAAMQRVERILPEGSAGQYDPELFEMPAEHRLHEALTWARTELQSNGTGLSHFVDTAASLVQPIETFFTDVLVMAKDPAVRANRLGLLAAIRDLGSGELAWRELH